jgi:hypothetical protein
MRKWLELGADELLLILFAIGIIVLFAFHAFARDNGWENTPPKVRDWFQSLMQPDNPAVSCCGEADAYEADDYLVEGDHYIAIITDTRSDTFYNGSFRPHIEPGTKIMIPNAKMKWDAGNPSGHGYVFIGSNGQLYCYITPASI